MIDLIMSLTWTPYGIQCPDAQTAHKVHRFLREAILDRHIYISKVIGFTIQTNNTFRASNGDYITRHEQIGESYPEMMVKLQDKVFLNAGSKYLDSVLTTGMNDVINSPFGGSSSDNVIEVLYENPETCRCLKKETILRVAIMYDCGYKHMSENCRNFDKTFYPCNTDFSLAPFFRVLPMVPGAIMVPIRYHNGATEAQFKDILNKWSLYMKTGSIKEVERLWWLNFEL